MSAPCSVCGDSGWVPYPAETTEGELEMAYRLCGCKASGTATPTPCRRPGCDGAAHEGDSLCGRHRAAWDMNASLEAWNMAADTLESFAKAMHTGLNLDQLDEAMQVAVDHANDLAEFYASERDRIGGAW